MQDARRTMYILVFAFWMLVLLNTYFMGWSAPPRPEGQASSTLPFFIVAIASAAAGIFVMYRALARQTPLAPGVFQTQLLVSMALLEFTALLAIFVVGPVRYEPMTQLLVGISAIAIPIVGFGGLTAYWRSRDA